MSQTFNDRISQITPKRRYAVPAAILVAGAALAGAYFTVVEPRPATVHMAKGSTPDATAARPVTEIKPISCTPLPDIPRKAVTMAIVNFPPDAYTPRHHHPGNVTAFVLKGTLRSQLAGEPPITYSEGQSWFEPKGAIHLFAENASKTEPASLLAMLVADENCGPLTILLPEDHEGHAN